MVLFQEPTPRYSSRLVNVWVSKTWREDGQRIPCRYEVFDPEIEIYDRTLVIYSHGNAEDLLSCTHFIQDVSTSLKTDIVSWDYSGYGLNPHNEFERTPEGINLSLKTLHNHFLEEGYRPENILFWGYSLGTGPTIKHVAELCQNENTTNPKGMVLFGAYSSILQVVSDATNEWIAQRFEERWNSNENIRKIDCPVLLMHGQRDGLISMEHSKRLKESRPEAKLVILPNTGHTTFSWTDCLKEVRSWLSSDLK